MSETIPIPQPARPKEIALFAGAMAGIIIVQLLISGGVKLIPRHFWLDEIHTALLVSDSDFSHSMRALAGGVDTNPPTMFVLMRIFALPFGSADESSLRIFSLASVWLALVGTYACLRFAYTIIPAAAGVMCLWAHELMIRHAFEARFYGPLLAATVWTCFFLWNSRHARKQWVNSTLLAISSLLLCTIHYFGVFAFALLLVTYIATNRKNWKDAWPALAGPIALALWIPIYLKQRSNFTVPTWIESTNVRTLLNFFDDFIPSSNTVGEYKVNYFILALVATVVIGIIVRALLRDADRREPWIDPIIRSVGLISLVLLVVMVIAFSIIVQPALQARYAIAGLTILAVLVAQIVSRGEWRTGLLVCLIFITVGTMQIGRHTRRWATNPKHNSNQEQVDAMIDQLRALGNVPAVFDRRQNLYPIVYLADDLRQRCYFLDFQGDPPADFDPPPGKATIADVDRINYRCFERDMARNNFKWYRWPKLVTPDSLSGLGNFVIVGEQSRIISGRGAKPN